MKSTIKFLVLTMLLVIAIAALAGCAKPVEHNWTEATCTAPKTCTDCGAVEGEALGHTEQILAGKAATCTETGLTEGKKCSVCFITIEAQTTIPVDTTAHPAEKIVAVDATPATCTATGLTAGEKCEACGIFTVAQETTAIVPHDTYVFAAAQEATCTVDGATAHIKCHGCSYEVLPTVVPASHHYSDWEVTLQPTENTAGEKQTVCPGCGTVVTEDIPALGTDDDLDIDEGGIVPVD